MIISIFFKTVLLAITLIKYTVIDGASGSDEFVLQDKSFTIKSTITSFNFGLIDLGIARLTESYSKEFRRARLDYQLKDSVASLEEFYYDPKVGAGITLSKAFKTCSRVPLNVLYFNINLNSEEMKSLLKFADSNNEDLNYIIGPSKLLFLLAKHTDDMEVILNPNEDDEKIRGHQVIRYKLELLMDQNRKAKFNLFYDKTSYSDNQSLRSTIPLQAYITFSNSKVYYIIDYYSREIFSKGKLVHPRFDLADKNSLILVDQFAYPTSFECNQFMDDSSKGNLFESYDLTSIRYSFNARSKPLLGRTLQHFVAFDGMTSVLRIDTKWTDSKQQQIGCDGINRDYIQVIDFRTNRKYTYVNNPKLNSDCNEQSKLLFSLLGDKLSHCSIMYADEPEKSQRDFWSLSKLLTGADKFTFMGYGQVRGVDALIYEGKSESVPYWFSQPMLFKDKNNNFRFKELGEMIKQDLTRQIKYEYSVVFYIANNEEKIIKPLLLEYYDLRIDKSSDYRRSLVIKFNNFIWDLNDSPNGDSPIELFSLKDYCSSSSGDDKYAQVDLLLEEDLTMQKEEEGKVNESINNWVSNNIIRNEALISGFRYVMEIQSVMLYDLQSKVFKQDNKHKILASFRVAEHPRVVYHLTFIGNAELNKEYLESMLVVHSLTITECLWLVGESQKPIYIHYSQLTSSCVIDKQLSESSSVDIRDSKLFILRDQVVGELYRVESHYDSETSLRNSWLREANFNQLENRKIILQSNQQGDPIQPINPNDLKMRIKKVKIDNVNFMNKIGNEDNTRQIKPPSRVYSGFTLPIDEQTKVFKLKNSNNIGSSSNKLLSQEQCHAACLADLNCKSFSYCVQLPDIVCILSTVGFVAPGIREHLESRDVQNLARGSKVLIKTMNFSIEIIRDFRCELYNKNYIDLFTRSKGGLFPLKNLIIIPVNSEEECAKMCFADSLETIKLSVEIGKNIKTLLLEGGEDNSDDDKELINQNHNEYLEVSSKFCKFFLYLDTTLSVEERQIIKQATEESHKNVESNNYCAINGLPNRSVNDDKLDSTKLLFNNYKFQFKSLYEKRYGYILERSQLNEKEEEAYKNVIQQKQLEINQYELLKNSLSEGKNFQKELHFDADICAYECFLQHSGLWPACRSFDNMIVSYKWDNTVGLDNLCYLNTEVDSQNQYSPADSDSKTRSIQVWHYMPRFGVISEEGDDYFDLGALDERNNFKHKEKSKIGYLFKVISNVFIITLLSTLGIICGLFIGFKSTERFVRGKLIDRMPDRVMLSPNL